MTEESKVHSPSHYNAGEIETIDYIRDQLSEEEFAGYCEGNILKYLSRYKHKNGIEDLEKAQVHLQWLIDTRKQIESNEIAYNIGRGF